MTVALVVPLAAPPRLMKKLTVIGMIGHTHGVKIANRPPSKPMRKMTQRDWVSDASLSFIGDGLSAWVTNSHVSGAVHILSSQAL